MASSTVNRPTNIKQKEQDVNQKLQLYGIITAFQHGKVPSNGQIDVALNSFLDANYLKNPSKKLSVEGQGLVRDFRDVVEQAKYLLLSKNEGNILQDFIWQTQQISGGSATLPSAPVDKDTAKQHGNEALKGLRTLGTLIVSNGQFRKLLNDATILLRDMAGDAASTAAAKVKPSDEQLSSIDHPAEDNTWHEVPDLSVANIKDQMRSTYDKNKPVSATDIRDAAGNATETTQQTNSGAPANAGIQAGTDTLRDHLDGEKVDNIKEKTNKTRLATKERTISYLSEKVPQERRDQTIYRLKKMVVEIQGHTDYQSAVNTLLDLAETYGTHANTVGQHAANSVEDAHTDDALKTAEADLKLLIERFANNTSSDDLWDSINQMYKDADQDPELKSWFRQMNTYIRKCLKQQGFILEDAATEEWNALYDRGNFLLRDRYRNHTDRVVDEIKFIGDQFDKDPQNKRFAESMNKLFQDLGNDENGKPTFKPHLLKDLSEVILPAIFENIRYVPIPRIEYSDKMMDAVVENLVIESDNLMPNAVEFAADNYWRWGRKGMANKHKNAVMISVTGVQMDLRDVSFYIKKKEGFPSITDLGVADIFLGGSGFSFKLKVSSADSKDRHNFFKVDKVDVDVKNFNIKLKQSKHKLLFGLFKPLMLKVIRPALQKVIEKLIIDKFAELDALAYEIKMDADRAANEVKQNPEEAKNIYSRYVEAAKKKVMQGKQKTQEVVGDKKMNVAMTTHDSIFPQIKLPGGISTKATEYKELAAKGEKWESPIFSIGSASKSTSIPSAGDVKRKNHAVTEGGVRGPQNVGTNGINGFSKEVDHAFGKTNGNGNGNGTTLGSHNPVLTGSTGVGI